MSMLSSRPAITARSMLRRHPRVRNSVAYAVSLCRPRRGYEEYFKSAMLKRVRPGDCIWDVGANVGLYSELFASATGPAGKVISFEPAPACAAALEDRRRANTTGVSWQILPVALSDTDGEAWLSTARGATAPANHLTSRGEDSAVQVQKRCGDSLVAAGYDPPALIKIDVEGHEGEVLDGMSSVLSRPALRTICLEVHFGQLAERGKPREPARIAELLQDHGFSIEWTDLSHLIARR